MFKNIKLASTTAFLALALLSNSGCGSSSSDDSNNTTTTSTVTTLVSGTASISTTSTSSSSRNSRAVSCGSSGKVILFAATDTDYATALSNEIAIDTSTCKYSVTEDDLTAAGKAASTKDYIIKVVMSDASGQAYEMSALSTESSRATNSEVSVDPVSTMVKAKIMETIQSIFGADVTLSDTILATVSALAEQVATEVKSQVDAGTLVLKSSQFETSESATADEVTDTGTKAQASKMVAEMSNLDIPELSLMETELKDTKFKELASEVDFTTTDGQNSDGFKKAYYNMVVGMLKAAPQMAINSGDGESIIIYLPVDSKYISTLPGERYSETLTSTDTNGKNIIFGDDSFMRKIDANSLKTLNGTEVYFEELMNKINFAFPSNMVKQMVINYDKTTTLHDLGEVLKFKNKVDGTATNPFDNLEITISSDIKESAKAIVEAFGTTIIASKYGEFFWHNLDKSMNEFWESDTDAKKTAAFENFTDLFKASSNNENKDTFITRLKTLDVYKDLVKDQASLFARAIPSKASEGVLQWSDMTITKDTKLTPLQVFLFTNMIMSGGSDMSIVTSTDASSDMSWIFSDGNFGSTITSLATHGIWVPTWSEDTEAVPGNFFESLGKLLNSSLTTPDVTDNNIANIMTDATRTSMNTKLESAKNSDRMDPNALFGDNDSASTTLSMTIKDGNGSITNSYKLKITPLFEDTSTGEWKEGAATTMTPTSGEISENVTLYSDSVRFNYNDTAKSFIKSSTGTYRFTGMFRAYMITTSDNTTTFIGEWPLFPSATNDLGEFYFDPSWFSGKNEEFKEFEGFKEGEDFDDFSGGNHFEHISSTGNIFYPNFETTTTKVGEEFLALDFNSSVSVSTITALSPSSGTLSGATITMKVLAANWDTQEAYWESMSGGTTKTSITIGGEEGLQEGGMVEITIADVENLKTTKLMLVVNWIDSNSGEFDISIFPAQTVDSK